MARKPRIFGKTAGQRGYDMQRQAQKRAREGRERDNRRMRQWSRRGPGLGCLLPVLMLLALAVISCGGSTSGGNGPEETIGKYEQTWTKSYATTTCVDWTSAMDAHQQFVMAGDMLLAGYRGDDPSADIPEDVYINRLVDAVTTTCTGGGNDIELKIAEAVATLYVMSNDLGP